MSTRGLRPSGLLQVGSNAYPVVSGTTGAVQNMTMQQIMAHYPGNPIPVGGGSGKVTHYPVQVFGHDLPGLTIVKRNPNVEMKIASYTEAQINAEYPIIITVLAWLEENATVYTVKIENMPPVYSTFGDMGDAPFGMTQLKVKLFEEKEAMLFKMRFQ